MRTHHFFDEDGNLFTIPVGPYSPQKLQAAIYQLRDQFVSLVGLMGIRLVVSDFFGGVRLWLAAHPAENRL
jgi:hypothetical protein